MKKHCHQSTTTYNMKSILLIGKNINSNDPPQKKLLRQSSTNFCPLAKLNS